MATSSPFSPAGNIGDGDGWTLTASAIVAKAVSRSHVLKIDGYSRTKGLGNGKPIDSEIFAAGGHRWRMRYYPDGYRSEDADWISIFLWCIDRVDANEVKAEFRMSLLDQDGQLVPLYSICTSQIRAFSSKGASWGMPQLIKRKDLEESLYLRDDAFSIRCDVTVSKEIVTEWISPCVTVPPSNMHQHLGQLLLAGEAADVTFEVGAETFAVHRCVLAAPSSVFKAELLGPMKEKTATLVRIDDMEAGVFRALLHFIYTDTLPTMDDEGDAGVAMAQHLLVAADRYNLVRLKLICKGKLCDQVSRGTVATTMALAEQHGCTALKKACFKFLTSPGNMKAVMASDGFEHVRSSCPSVRSRGASRHAVSLTSLSSEYHVQIVLLFLF